MTDFVEQIAGIGASGTSQGAVSKPDFAGYETARNVVICGTAAEVLASDLSKRTLVFVAEYARFYRKDTADKTTVASESLVRDNNGIAFKVIDASAEQVAFSANKNGTNQTGITSATQTKITFGTEDFDVGSYYDAGNSKFLPPEGYYLIGATLLWSAGLVDQEPIAVYLRKNGITIAESFNAASGVTPTSVAAVCLVYADGSDYFEVYGAANGAGDKTVGGNARDSGFWAIKVDGFDGIDGRGLQPDAVGTYSGRSTFDDEAANFAYLSTDGDAGATTTAASMFYKLSATSADWSGPIPVRGQDGTDGTDGTDGADGASILVQDSEPATSYADGSLWIDSDSTDLDLYQLTSGSWVDTGKNLKGTGAVAENLLINGTFDIWQRGASFDSTTTPANNDGNYLADRWCLLSDGNDIVDVSQETSIVPNGALSSIKLDIETANKRCGLLQIIENANTVDLLGSVASLSFSARKGAGNSTVDTLRAIVLTWDGTADSPTRDVVSAWGTEGNNPTPASNWTIEGSSTFALTNSFQQFTLENISIDTASGSNVAVLLMIENDDATVGDLVYIGDAKLEAAAAATMLQRRNIAAELSLCLRYYWQSDPGNGVPTFTVYNGAGAGQGYHSQITLPQIMRVDPTITVNGTWNLTNCTGPTVSAHSKTGFLFSLTSSSTGISTIGPNSADDYLYADAEL